MSSRITSRLAALGITIPVPAAPVASYIPFVRTGQLLFISGQICFEGSKVAVAGKLGGGVSLEDGQRAARICAINLIAQMQAALGDLDRVAKIVKLTGFVASAPSFTDQPKVINGCSDLLVEVFGEAGKHARSAVGVAALPLDAAVEVEAIVEISG